MVWTHTPHSSGRAQFEATCLVSRSTPGRVQMPQSRYQVQFFAGEETASSPWGPPSGNLASRWASLGGLFVK